MLNNTFEKIVLKFKIKSMVDYKLVLGFDVLGKQL